MSYLAGSLFTAGSDTESHATYQSQQTYSFLAQTAVGITAMIMAAACHPLAQAKVHEELDTVIGSDRGIPKWYIEFDFSINFRGSTDISRLKLTPSIARVLVGSFEMETYRSHR
jgi:hypothetical protein